MTTPPWLVEARARLAAIGVDVVGVADGAAWSDRYPGTRSVVVVGSRPRALWSAFTDHLRAHPEAADQADPLDAFVAATVRGLGGGTWVRCAADDGLDVDFRGLAVAAGLGHPSRLGLVVHPEVGPWLGLRAACFTPDVLTPTGPLPGDGPCATCDAPCAPACPAGAIGPDGIDIGRSWTFRQGDARCDGGCLARDACPVGAEHRPDDATVRYHMHGPSRRGILERVRRPPAGDDTRRGS